MKIKVNKELAEKLNLKEGLKIQVLKEGKEGFSIVWLNNDLSVVKSGINSLRDYDAALKDAKKEFISKTGSDDFWIDDIWYDGKEMPTDMRWVDLFKASGSQNIDSDIFEAILNDPESGKKMMFLNNFGYDINEDNLEEVYIWGPGSNKVKGNFNMVYPEDWLEEQAETYYPDLAKNLMDANADLYFDWARLFSDAEVSGDFKSDWIGKDFIWAYIR